MSGHSYSNPCPVCGKSMSVYSDRKPFDNISGQCMNCGFEYWTQRGQMGLETINEQRAEWNENNEGEKDYKPLKPLTQKDLDKWKDKINDF